MIGQILPNNNKRCYSNFSPTFHEVNTPYVKVGMLRDGDGGDRNIRQAWMVVA
jgi:hypothetical protein